MTVVAALVGGLLVGGLTAWILARRRGRKRDEALDQARRRLESARAARETFFDLTNHELRSPLSAILGYQELLRDDAYGELPDDAHDAVERIGRSARHLLNLIDGVMELSRIRTGAVHLDLDTVELGVVFSSTVEAFRSHASDRGINPVVELPRRIPAIRTDQDRLVRALDLVVTSAIRHPEGDTMELRVDEHDDGVTLVIGPVDLELDPDIGDPAGRMGIRLAVAHRVARLLGGGLELPAHGAHAHRIVFHVRDADPAARPGGL